MPGGVGRHASAKIHLLHSVDRQSINAVAASLDKPGDHVVANAAEELVLDQRPDRGQVLPPGDHVVANAAAEIVLGPGVGLTHQYHRFWPLHLCVFDRTTRVWRKSVSVRLDLGGRRLLTTQN